ncbi:MAG TPA: glycosyltransferase, partial [Thermoanaerobaculia bacterium]|nr:glycosyltransferase [Thermoanaerobaculia bacterium]
MNANGQTICLNMIVRNEAPVIRRCLDSVRPLIDHWVIVDTGSTDGTQDIIREHLRDVPGELFERPWVDFGTNRTQALELARGRADYLFFIDADEVLVLHDGFGVPPLIADCYECEMRLGPMTYSRLQLVRAALPWRWEGVMHEYVHCDEAKTCFRLEGLHTEPHRDGARARDVTTARKDALVLEQALLTDPDNARHVFYLAQSYAACGDYELAIRNYRRRVSMGGFGAEVAASLYRLATLRDSMGAPWPEVMADYLAAYEHTPDAAPLYRIGVHAQRQGDNHTAYLFLREALELPYPRQTLFVERPLFDFQIALEFAVAAFFTGRHVEAIRINNQLLRSGKVPPELVDQVIRNRRASLEQRPRESAVLADPAVTVIVPFMGDADAFATCIDSVAMQDLESFRAVAIAPGPVSLPDDTRFSAIEVPPGSHAEESIVRVARAAPGNSVVMVLLPRDRFAHASVLRSIVEDFRNTGCALHYGQHRMASGQRGNAEPAPEAEAFRAKGPARAGASTLAFRADLLAGPLPPKTTLENVLWQRAGFERTWFSDEIVTIVPGGAPAKATTREKEAYRSSVIEVLPAPPKISCLMITKDRLLLAERAIRAFAEQSYRNRELVIVSESAAYRRALERCAERLGVKDVKMVAAADQVPIGQLRNLALDAASGEILCQWDDDDWHHRDRLVRQAETMLAREAGACGLTGHLHYFEPDALLFVADWTLGGQQQQQAERLFPPSMMWRRDERVRYPVVRGGEDSALLTRLLETVPVAELTAPELYLYQYHTGNLCTREHHQRIARMTSNTDLLESL